MRIRRVFMAMGLTVFMPFIGAGSCGGDGDGGTKPETPPVVDQRSQCPDITFRSPDERCLILQTFIESRLGPYEVHISITGGNGAYPSWIPVASGGWKHSLVYRTGIKMNISMTVEPSARGSKDGYCSITDGSVLVKDTIKNSRPDGSGIDIAVCQHVTVQ